MTVELGAEIDAKRQHIRSDGYQMSIGEFSNLYRDREIVIRPEYQRLFRWDIDKKSRLIESILLGIPLPSIFVAEDEEGVWEVVDGLQRLSTLFEFMGMLRDEEKKVEKPASSLVGTKYLPGLEGKYYDNEGDPANSLTVGQRLAIKRAKLDVKILQRGTDPSVRFELFDRLNSGGQPTSEQEVRSAQLLMTFPDFFRWLDARRNGPNFQDCLPLTDRQVSEQYDLELVVRFLVLFYSRDSALSSFADFDSLLTDQAEALATGGADTIKAEYSLSTAESIFERTFAVLESVGIDVFRRYDSKRDRLSGAFSVSTFEAVTVGVAANIDAWESLEPTVRAEKLAEACKRLSQDQRFRDRSGAGIRATQRIPVMVKIGPEIFRP